MVAQMYGGGSLSEHPKKVVWIFQTTSEAAIIGKNGGVAVCPIDSEHFELLKERNVIVWARDSLEGAEWRYKALTECAKHCNRVRFVSKAPGLKVEESIVEWNHKNEVGIKEAIKTISLEDIPEELKPDSKIVVPKIKPTVEYDYDPNWEDRLIYGGKKLDILKPSLGNLQLIFANHHLWRGVLGFNIRTLEEVILKNAPWDNRIDIPAQLKNHHATRVVLWLQDTYNIVASSSNVHDAMSAVAQENPIDPVRTYLDLLYWDGKTRLDTWLTDFAGAESNDYIRSVGAKFLISLVARTYDPGCQVDTMLILEGPQGAKKSSMLRVLAREDVDFDNFCDNLEEFKSRDAKLKINGPVIVEFSELDSMNRSEVTAIKSFVTSKVDKFRPPYDRKNGKFPRRCVFAGTTNEETYLKDKTGGRRFWPVKTTKIDIPALKRERDQIMAEAVYRYKKGEIWWFEGESEQLATKEQEQRQQQDEWISPIQRYLIKTALTEYIEKDDDRYNEFGERAFVENYEILSKCLELSAEKQTVATSMRVGNILRNDLNWTRKKIRNSNGLTKFKYVYFPPPDFIEQIKENKKAIHDNKPENAQQNLIVPN